MHTGDLIAQLRRDRGLTQQDVADAAGRSVQTVRAIEQNAEITTTTKTLAQVLAVLDRTSPLADDAVAALGAACGKDLAPLLPSHRRALKLRALVSEAAPLLNTPENRLLMSVAQLEPDERTIMEEVFDLIDAYGARRTLVMVRALRTIAAPPAQPTFTTHAPAPEPTRILTHVSPPIKRPDGAVEEVHTDIAVPARPTARSTPKRKEA